MGELIKKPIGVFDSGMGGISVLANLIHDMPNENFIYYGDSNNAPYGVRPVEEIKNLSINICDFLLSQGVKAIVVACNTATSAAIVDIRDKYSIPIVGMEPALKPAIEANEDKNDIIVMATETTLREEKFQKLMNKYAEDTNIIKLPAPKLVTLVESDLENKGAVRAYLNEILSPIDLDKVASIVLGCTHFIFIKDILMDIIKEYNIDIIDGNKGTTNHLKSLLDDIDALSSSDIEGSVVIYNSINNEKIIDYSKELLIKRIDDLNKEVV